jgi:hypothetical protein
LTIRALSASQAERFDPEQVGGCKRRWYFQNVMRLEVPESEASKEDGHAGHALFALWYRFGDVLPKRHRMLKAVRGALATGQLPAREPGQLVESRFDGQPARDANGERLPLRPETTLWLGGVPWDGYVDLRFYRDRTITVLDHKFSSDIHAYAKTDLLGTVQMPVYALDSLRLWPEAEYVELVHHYVSRRGVDSFLRRQLVSVAQVRQRGREIEKLVAEMLRVLEAKSPEDVPGNRRSCHTWSGCPFQSRCTAFKEKPKMDLSDEEMSWLNVVGGGEAPAKEKPRCELCGGVPDHAHGDCPSLTKPGREAQAATELEVASAAGALSPHEDPFAVFDLPKASTPQEQPAKPPSCPDCGTELNAENGSQKDGKWKHIGCPAGETAGYQREIAAQGAEARGAVGPKCPACPHPAHSGAACTGKRGSRNCRCKGLVENVTQAHESTAIKLGHLPTCVQNDAGKWLCMEGCTAGQESQDVAQVLGLKIPAPERSTAAAPIDDWISAALERERDMHRCTLGELDASERERNAMKKELERLRNLEQQIGEAGPIPLLLWCPACHARHLDEGEFAEKPHHTHACQSCGLAWRPAVAATVGVQFLPGFKND